jgi:hypothetical protein
LIARSAAAAWLKKPEAERSTADCQRPTPGDVIDRYISESKKAIGRTKEQILGAIKSPTPDLRCSAVGSDEISTFAAELVKKVEPQTVGNYLSHLGAVFAVAQPLWKYPLDRQAMKDALTALKRMG